MWSLFLLAILSLLYFSLIILLLLIPKNPLIIFLGSLLLILLQLLQITFPFLVLLLQLTLWALQLQRLRVQLRSLTLEKLITIVAKPSCSEWRFHHLKRGCILILLLIMFLFVPMSQIPTRILAWSWKKVTIWGSILCLLPPPSCSSSYPILSFLSFFNSLLRLFNFLLSFFIIPFLFCYFWADHIGSIWELLEYFVWGNLWMVYVIILYISIFVILMLTKDN